MVKIPGTLVLLASLLAPVAHAADVVLLPHATASGGVEQPVADRFEALVSEVMRDNEFVVLTPEVVQGVLGPVLESCTTDRAASCASVALNGTPARMAVLLNVFAEEGRSMLQVDFVGPEDEASMRQMVLPLEEGKERRLALQVTMFAIDVAQDMGPAPAALVDSARHLVGADGVVPRIEGPDVDDLLDDEEIEAFDDPLELDGTPPEGAPVLEVPDEILEPEERGEVGNLDYRDSQIPRRLYLGSEGSYERHKGVGEAWIKRNRPHAGRFILELRGGVGIGDVSRNTTVLGEPSSIEGQLVSTFFQEAPQLGTVGRGELFLGYAPATMIDIGVLVGANIASDDVTVGYMAADSAPDLGPTEPLTVPRVYVQPRARVYVVPIGVAKPYLMLGAEMVVVPDWEFEITTNEPFPRPAGGVMPGFLGGGGLVIDPSPRVGVVLEATGTRYFGALSGPRFGGELVGGQPPALQGVRRWAVGIAAGLQLRL